jgi:hypothetical protein
MAYFRVFLLCLWLMPTFLFAQFSTQWVNGLGGTLSDGSNAVVADGAGDVIQLGVFQGTLDFAPGASVVNLTAAPDGSAFVRKMDVDGDFIWAVHLEGSGNSFGEKILVDVANNIYVVGGFKGSVDVDPGPGTDPITATGTEFNAFIWKLDANGALIWARVFATDGTCNPRDVAIDPMGDIYISGDFSGNTDFDPANMGGEFTAVGIRDGFVAKVAANGDFQWAAQLENSVTLEGKAIAVNAAGETFTTGKFWGTADFDPGASVANETAVGADDTFVLKLNPAGELAWVLPLGGAGYEYGHAIELDNSGNIWLAGSFQQTLDLDPGPGTSNVVSNGGDDVFIVKLDANGNYLWGQGFGDVGGDAAFDMSFDENDGPFLIGQFEGTVDFDVNGMGGEYTSQGQIDVFLQKYDTDGNYVWTQPAGSPLLELGLGLDYDPLTMSLYAVGYFQGTADFDPPLGTYELTSSGEFDSFLWRLRQDPLNQTQLERAFPSITVFPNPAWDAISVQPFSESESFRVFTIDGREVTPQVELQDEGILNIERLPSGHYILQTPRGTVRWQKQ